MTLKHENDGSQIASVSSNKNDRHCMANLDSSIDLTKGPIWRPMLKIAIPAATGMVFNTLYAMTDSFFAGEISTLALAGLSLTFPVYILMMAVGIGISQGTSVLVANAIGVNNRDKALRYVAQALSLSAFMGLLAAALVWFWGQEILSLFVNDAQLVETGMLYAGVVALSAPFMAITFTCSGVMTAQGQAKPYRNVVIITFFINLFLNPLLALDTFYLVESGEPSLFAGFGLPFGFGLGLVGIALATVLIQAISAIAMVSVLLGAPIAKGWQPGLLKIDWKTLGAILREGFAASMNMLMIAAGSFIAQHFAVPLGQETVAAQGVGLRINQLFLLPLIGLSSAMMAIVGQAYGAKLGKRVLAAYAQLMGWGILGMLVFSTYIAFSAGFWASLFSDDPEVLRLTVIYLYVTVPMMPIWSIVFLSQAFCQALKRPYLATLVNITRQIPFPFLLVPWTYAIMGSVSPLGLWIGIAIGNLVGALVLLSYSLWIAPGRVNESWSTVWRKRS